MLLISKNKTTTTIGDPQMVEFTDLNSTAASFLLELRSNATNEVLFIASAEAGTITIYRPRWVSFGFRAATVELQAPFPTYDLSGPKYPEGYYGYTIYAQTTEYNLDPSGLTVVNSGIAFLQDEDGAFTEATYISNTDSVEGYTYYTE
tara:strand:- start:735 stop:1178 length:444 start_codon:yes stop_codon:yes gene_type:complete